MRLRERGARIVQRPVEHFPRQHGEQTGANLSVILTSLAGLLGLFRGRMSAALLIVAAELALIPLGDDLPAIGGHQ